ncbi:hypothetical protein P2G88_02995 [Aliiglaciecola sp. CAU 1673]|uniref:hypothetical protein n=1 Tax=Aliiglaciecola sp. CAU 1673 TaxID=3032595 RepID=UPI0023DB8F36|nr:hypothetical protein [Aliiglaciecola sp. CAU 1673]MDF2177208.1 hypothetical protein [Aliiglaciecola sp. CAU 1673]
MERLTDTSQKDEDFPSPTTLWQRIRYKLGLPNKKRNGLSFKEKVGQLTLSQWSYLAAFVALLATIQDVGEDRDIQLVVIVLAGVGLGREMWHLFHKIWEQTLGKGLLLVLYAGTANFALALAALKINNIAGVEPSPFVFTLGFTTLLTLPFWLVAATVFFFSLALVAGNLWLLITLLLRLIGIRLPIHWEDKSFVISFMILRIIIIPVVIVGLLELIEPYAEQLDIFKPRMEGLDESLTAEQVAQLKDLRNTDPEKITALLQSIKEQQQTDNAINAASQEAKAPGTKPVRFLDQMVANFIYHFETYPHSACAKKPEQHSLTIDDYSMFVAEKDSSPLGVKFSVEPCVPRYNAVAPPEENVPPSQQ